MSALVQTFHPTRKVDVFNTLRVIDHGNVAVPPFSAELARGAIEAEESARSSGQGSCRSWWAAITSITYPILRAVARAHGPVALVHVDAHLDTSGPEVWGDAFHHGTPIRHAIDEDLVARNALHQIGIRATWGSPEEGALVAEHGGRLSTWTRSTTVASARSPAESARRSATDRRTSRSTSTASTPPSRRARARRCRGACRRARPCGSCARSPA